MDNINKALNIISKLRKPIFVFNMKIPGNIVRAVSGEDIGTLITR